MKSDDSAPVAVVGGGFSGLMAAVQLARRRVPVTLFEAGPDLARGTAYGTRDPNHLLNVPAAKMSAWPDAPADFQEWLGAQPGDFAPRRDFGAYLESILAAHPGIEVERSAVERLIRNGDGWSLRLTDGRRLIAPAVVLALGNEPPAAPPGWDALPTVGNPWSKEAQRRLGEAAKSDAPILLIGTGLTMVDVMLSLEANGYAGTAVAVSRRGLLPRAHAAHEPAPVALDRLPSGNLLALWRWLRRRTAEVGFRAAVDSLRPHSAGLWQSLADTERRRFLRHARPWWDVHRHRIAPEVAERLQGMIADGRLEVLAGRLSHSGGDGVAVQRRGGGERRLAPALVVNCTGPLGDVRNSRNPLLRQLLADGLVTCDPLGIGLRTDADDRAAPALWALGPLTKGMYWEITAVPDIRGQAERVAMAIETELLVHG